MDLGELGAALRKDDDGGEFRAFQCERSYCESVCAPRTWAGRGGISASDLSADGERHDCEAGSVLETFGCIVQSLKGLSGTVVTAVRAGQGIILLVLFSDRSHGSF